MRITIEAGAQVFERTVNSARSEQMINDYLYEVYGEEVVEGLVEGLAPWTIAKRLNQFGSAVILHIKNTVDNRVGGRGAQAGRDAAMADAPDFETTEPSSRKM